MSAEDAALEWKYTSENILWLPDSPEFNFPVRGIRQIKEWQYMNGFKKYNDSNKSSGSGSSCWWTGCSQCGDWGQWSPQVSPLVRGWCQVPGGSVSLRSSCGWSWRMRGGLRLCFIPVLHALLCGVCLCAPWCAHMLLLPVKHKNEVSFQTQRLSWLRHEEAFLLFLFLVSFHPSITKKKAGLKY